MEREAETVWGWGVMAMETPFIKPYSKFHNTGLVLLEALRNNFYLDSGFQGPNFYRGSNGYKKCHKKMCVLVCLSALIGLKWEELRCNLTYLHLSEFLNDLIMMWWQLWDGCHPHTWLNDANRVLIKHHFVLTLTVTYPVINLAGSRSSRLF